MTAVLPPVVVPYTEFLERRERRVQRASVPAPSPDAPPTIEAEVVAVACSKPPARREAHRADDPGRG